jgi:signal transduction histidine kinase
MTLTLTRRLFLMSLLVALPTAFALVAVVDARRTRDARVALERVARGHLTDVVRDACVNDSQWFLAGPRTGRPSMAERQRPDADVFLPRPSTDELPFEVFAYDESLAPTSTAGPRMPTPLRDAFRESPKPEVVHGDYSSKAGPGIVVAVWTGWSGPCAILLFRQQPRPGIWAERAIMFAGFTGAIFIAAVVAFAPTVRRMRRVALLAGESTRGQFESIAPDPTKDEISAMAYAYNDAAKEVHTRRTEIADRIEALRRYTVAVEKDIAAPLASLAAAAAALAAAPGAGEDARRLLREAHDVRMRLRNVTTANHLRQNNDSLRVEQTDVRGIVQAAIDEQAPFARAAGVTLRAGLGEAPVMAPVHAACTQQAIGNLIDNAIRHGGAGGDVRIDLRPAAESVFRLTIANERGGVTDDLFKGLTAIRRFRGDEGWNRRPNAPGLGLAVTREIADRSGLGLDLQRTPGGGLLVTLTGGQTPTRG